METKQTYKVESRIWISTDSGMYLGRGRIRLLQEIDRLGSIAKAAEAMEMSYKKAWKLIKSMNEASPSPLLEKKIGGTGGGGSELTDEGKRVVELFNQLEKDQQASLDKRFKKSDF